MDKQGKVKPRTDQMWMCVLIRGNKIDSVNHYTLHYTRKQSIAEILYTKSGRSAYTWQQLRKWGWRCVKVNLSFEI